MSSNRDPFEVPGLPCSLRYATFTVVSTHSGIVARDKVNAVLPGQARFKGTQLNDIVVMDVMDLQVALLCKRP